MALKRKLNSFTGTAGTVLRDTNFNIMNTLMQPSLYNTEWKHTQISFEGVADGRPDV